MSFFLKDCKSIVKYDGNPWKNKNNDRNVFVVCDEGIQAHSYDGDILKPVVLILSYGLFSKFFIKQYLSANLKNEILITKDSHPESFQHNAQRFLKEFTDVSLIGRGGFGKVYLATNKTDLIQYAIKKVVFKYWKVKKDSFNQIITEFRILASLKHFNVVRYHTAWIETELITEENGAGEEDTSSETDRSVSDISRPDLDSVVVFGPQSDCSLTSVSDNQRRSTSTDSSTSHSSSDKSELGLTLPSNDGTSFGDISCKSISNEAVELFSRATPALKASLAVYIQMELCNDNLMNWLEARNRRSGLLDPEDGTTARSLARQLLSGVEYVHFHNIVHRDIKPANLFLVRHSTGLDLDLELKIGDFGLAKLLGSNDVGESEQQMSANVGTALYTAPEVYDKRHRYTKYDQKCDLYSVGVILLELMLKFPTVSGLVSTLRDIRRRGDSEELSLAWPEEARHVAALVSTVSAERPSAAFILHDTVAFREPVVSAEEQIRRLTMENSDLKTTVEKLRQEIELLRNNVTI